MFTIEIEEGIKTKSYAMYQFVGKGARIENIERKRGKFKMVSTEISGSKQNIGSTLAQLKFDIKKEDGNILRCTLNDPPVDSYTKLLQLQIPDGKKNIFGKPLLKWMKNILPKNTVPELMIRMDTTAKELGSQFVVSFGANEQGLEKKVLEAIETSSSKKILPPFPVTHDSLPQRPPATRGSHSSVSSIDRVIAYVKNWGNSPDHFSSQEKGQSGSVTPGNSDTASSVEHIPKPIIAGSEPLQLQEGTFIIINPPRGGSPVSAQGPHNVFSSTGASSIAHEQQSSDLESLTGDGESHITSSRGSFDYYNLSERIGLSGLAGTNNNTVHLSQSSPPLRPLSPNSQESCALPRVKYSGPPSRSSSSSSKGFPIR